MCTSWEEPCSLIGPFWYGALRFLPVSLVLTQTLLFQSSCDRMLLLQRESEFLLNHTFSVRSTLIVPPSPRRILGDRGYTTRMGCCPPWSALRRACSWWNCARAQSEVLCWWCHIFRDSSSPSSPWLPSSLSQGPVVVSHHTCPLVPQLEWGSCLC